MGYGQNIDVQRLVSNSPLGWYQISIIAICFFINILEGFDAQVLAFVVADISLEWGLPQDAFTGALAASIAGMVVGFPLLGSLGDRVGRKAVLVPALFAAGALTFLASQATSVGQLTLIRFMIGLALSGMTISLYAIASEFAPQRHRATAIVIVVSGFPLGGALGGLVTGQMLSHFGWREAVALAGIVPMVFAPLAFVLLPESVEFLALRGRGQDKIRRALVRLGRGHSFTEGNEFVSSEEKNTGRVQELFLGGRAPQTVAIWTMFVLGFFGMFCLFSWMPTILRSNGLSIEQAMTANASYQVGNIVGGLVLGMLLDRVAAQYIFGPILLLSALVFAAVALWTPVYFPLLALLFVLGFTFPGAYTSFNASASTFYPVGIRAVGIGWAQSMGRIGGILGAAAGGMMIAAGFGLAEIFGVLVVPCLAACIVSLFYTRKSMDQRSKVKIS